MTGESVEERMRVLVPGAQPSAGPVVLCDYDPGWPRAYAEHAARIRRALGDRARRLEHVGSTAVPGLAAKPVIDIVLALADPADEPAWLPPLEAVGDVLRSREPDWHEHRPLGVAQGSVNLHVFGEGCPEVDRIVAFRDRLSSDPADLVRYEAEKRRLAGLPWRHVQEYADAKSAVVAEIVARTG